MKHIYINLNEVLNSQVDLPLSSQLGRKIPLQVHLPLKSELDLQLYYQLRAFLHETLAKKYNKL